MSGKWGFVCHNCGFKARKIPDKYLGKVVPCPKCEAKVKCPHYGHKNEFELQQGTSEQKSKPGLRIHKEQEISPEAEARARRWVDRTLRCGGKGSEPSKLGVLKAVWNRFHANVFIDACKIGDETQVLSMLREEPELAGIKDKRGVSAFFYAVSNGHNKIAEAILRVSNQANDIEPEKGFTPLLVAATNGNIALVRLLLKYGADPDTQNIDGVTALHNAVFENQVDVARMLLEAGADPAIRDRLGNTAMDLASRSQNHEIRNLFKERIPSRRQEEKGNPRITTEGSLKGSNILFECCFCRFKAKVNSKYLGKRVKCPKCKNAVLIEAWYYAKDGEQFGPVSKAHLQKMLDSRILGPDVPIWSQSLAGWTPASKVGLFRIQAIPAPPPLPSKKEKYFGETKRVSDAKSKTDLIRRLAKKRVENDPATEWFRDSALEIIDSLSEVDIMGIAEATIVTIVETYTELKSRGLSDREAFEMIEAHRSMFGDKGKLPTSLTLPNYVKYRVALEHADAPLDEEFIEEAVQEARLFFPSRREYIEEEDIKICEKCGSSDFDYDNSWHEYTCKECGWISKEMDSDGISRSTKKKKKDPLMKSFHRRAKRKSEPRSSASEVKRNGTPRAFSWKSFLLAIPITFIITVIAAAANPGSKPGGVHWTLVWMVLTVEGWKYWRWKSLIPYPAFLLCASFVSALVGVTGGEISDVRIVNVALNVLGITVFVVIYYRRFNKERTNNGPKVAPQDRR